MGRYFVLNFTKSVFVKADDGRKWDELSHDEQMDYVESALQEINSGDAPMSIGDWNDQEIGEYKCNENE